MVLKHVRQTFNRGLLSTFLICVCARACMCAHNKQPHPCFLGDQVHFSSLSLDSDCWWQPSAQQGVPLMTKLGSTASLKSSVTAVWLIHPRMNYSGFHSIWIFVHQDSCACPSGRFFQTYHDTEEAARISVLEIWSPDSSKVLKTLAWSQLQRFCFTSHSSWNNTENSSLL